QATVCRGVVGWFQKVVYMPRSYCCWRAGLKLQGRRVVLTDFSSVFFVFNLCVCVAPPLERGVPGGVNVSVRLFNGVAIIVGPAHPCLSVCLVVFPGGKLKRDCCCSLVMRLVCVER
ncbi:unnamed protein product, partial [Ectocarpus sp. 4 AP-2014]